MAGMLISAASSRATQRQWRKRRRDLTLDSFIGSLESMNKMEGYHWFIAVDHDVDQSSCIQTSPSRRS
jgi:hypothetical protein